MTLSVRRSYNESTGFFPRKLCRIHWCNKCRIYSGSTPAVKVRPIQVTGSKGIHGAVFSEFALACILALVKKLPECVEAQKQ
ncbi:MAG TPA: hypothetical protein VGK65_08595, partial [Candidatus Binatia bacterium]